MRIDTTCRAAGSVDPMELDRHIAEMYRDVANEAGRDLQFPTGRPLAAAPGYPTELLGRVPAQAVKSFAGAGYHLGLAHLLPGERVLDLGSGSGMDVFAAASRLGPAGSVTAVDITPEQLAKSERLRRGEHVSFQRARIEELPFEGGSSGAAHEPQVRRSQRLAARAQAGTCIPPHLHPDLGDGADPAQAACEEGFTNTTTTQEVSI